MPSKNLRHRRNQGIVPHRAQEGFRIGSKLSCYLGRRRASPVAQTVEYELGKHHPNAQRRPGSSRGRSRRHKPSASLRRQRQLRDKAATGTNRALLDRSGAIHLPKAAVLQLPDAQDVVHASEHQISLAEPGTFYRPKPLYFSMVPTAKVAP